MLNYISTNYSDSDQNLESIFAKYKTDMPKMIVKLKNLYILHSITQSMTLSLEKDKRFCHFKW